MSTASKFSPMLAATLAQAEDARFPLLASRKLDGIRAIVINGVVMSRKLKPIPNQHVQRLFGKRELEGLDGELLVGPPGAEDVFLRTTSGVMSVNGEEDVAFHVFDHCVHRLDEFQDRLDLAHRVARRHSERGGIGCLVPVEHTLLTNLRQLTAFEERVLGEGFEGVMLRHPEAPYKYGRGTLTRQDLMKLKRFEDAEAVVLAVDEQLANNNPLERDNLGHAKRSSAKAGKAGKNVLGALRVRGLNGPFKDALFDIGTGFTDAQRKALWDQRGELEGRIVKYKFFPTGSKDAPRFPVFIGWRDRRDM